MSNMTLEQITDSEYNLLGAMDENEFLGALEAAPQHVKRRFFNKSKQNARAATNASSNRSRGEFERRIRLLPKEVQAGLAAQNLQAVDTAFYVVKAVEKSKVIKMFRDDDNKIVGLGNISSGKLEKGNFMLLWGIQVLAGVGSTPPAGTTIETSAPFDIKFDYIPAYLQNGEFEVKANGTLLIPNSSMSLFDTRSKSNVDMGLYVLDNPKILKDQHPIEMNIEWAVNAPVETYIKVILRGTAVIKA